MTNFRVDVADIKNWEIEPDTGYAKFLAPISREGYLTYRDAAGGSRREYVSRKTLRDSVHSFANKPVTLGHPSVPVTSENAKSLAVGWTGNAAKLDDRGILWLSGTVFDSDAIADIKSGNASQISCGYRVKLDRRGDGSFEQVEREGNHVAAVPRGRAGNTVAFHVDSEDDQVLYMDGAIVCDDDSPQSQKTSTSTRKRKKPMTIVNLDGVTLQLDDSVSTVDAQRHVNSINTELSKLRSDAEKHRDRADSQKETLDQLNSDLFSARESLGSSQGEVEQLKIELDATQARLDSLQLDYDDLENRSDSNDSEDDSEQRFDEDQVRDVLSEYLPECNRLWNEVTPLFRADNKDFEPDWGMLPAEIMMAAIKHSKPEMSAHLDSLDLEQESAIGAITGMYAMLAPAEKVKEEERSRDRVDALLTGLKKGRMEDASLLDADIAKEEAKKKRAKRIRNNGKLMMEEEMN